MPPLDRKALLIAFASLRMLPSCDGSPAPISRYPVAMSATRSTAWGRGRDLADSITRP